ncbi:MAG: TrbG/VirB9 family P-type conjugative transfer protein [Acetobacteraceae bacterium]
MRALSILLLASVAIAPMAQAAARHPAADSDIRIVSYSATRRVTIVGVVGQPTTITFPRGESVYRVVQSGKPAPDGSLSDAGWQGPSARDVKDTPLGNNLPLWPAVAGTSTMTVITMTKAGAQKVYAFRLIAKAKDDSGDPTYNLIFRGGVAPRIDPEVARRRRERRAAELALRQQAEAEQQLRDSSFREEACHYEAKGKYPNPLTPLCPISNGQQVIMRFPGLTKMPAVYAVNDDGTERLARQHASGDYVVVEELDSHFRLRLGADVLDIIDTSFNPVGRPTGTGTISPDVQRLLIRAPHQ